MKNFERSFLQQTQDSDKTKDTLRTVSLSKRQKKNICLRKFRELTERDESKKTNPMCLAILRRLCMKMETKNTHTLMTTGLIEKLEIGVTWKTSSV